MKQSDKTKLEKLASFEGLWKDEFSFLPEVPLDWKERKQWQSFAEQVYNRICEKIPIGALLDKAYDDGYEAGKFDYEDD